MPQVFISYVQANKDDVQRLAKTLKIFGLEVWLDRDQLRPGYRWKDAIREGISRGDYFIACFSAEYQNRSKTYMNEELILAVEELRKRPIDRAWFIPILLSECSIPDRSIGAGETLQSIQWVELYKNWEEGIKHILSVVQPDSARLYELIQMLKNKSARIRIRAADDLGEMGQLAKEAISSLTKALDDQNETVRAAAADALGKIGVDSERVISKLFAVMQSGEYYSSKHAAFSLAKMGKRAIPALVEATTYSGYGISSHAHDALGQIDDPEAVPTLINHLQSGYRATIKALGKIGKPAKPAVPYLI